MCGSILYILLTFLAYLSLEHFPLCTYIILGYQTMIESTCINEVVVFSFCLLSHCKVYVTVTELAPCCSRSVLREHIGCRWTTSKES